ncbi:hypothetical protein ACFPZ0_00620 [Streptomonospora nanhaiensis]|uniref:hypothetical protein n=1 Tax=Streptomonospora nanhaiensis TaxID=1323731 RepID=UPI001C992908|nr:hypothetical protein [Streptomonospora nanhaiensis]MBX9386938.1 hypothetical protein [Streptomonospora nanhaiensis]
MRVLVAGGMLSDVFVPMLDDDNGANDPVEDYLVGLRRLEDAAAGVDVVIPGHGSACGADQVRARIEQDRAYVHALRDGGVPDDPRIDSPEPGWEYVAAEDRSTRTGSGPVPLDVAAAVCGGRGSQRHIRSAHRKSGSEVAAAVPGGRESQPRGGGGAGPGHARWRPPFAAAEDRNLYAGTARHRHQGWRPPFAAAEERNDR